MAAILAEIKKYAQYIIGDCLNNYFYGQHDNCHTIIKALIDKDPNKYFDIDFTNMPELELKCAVFAVLADKNLMYDVAAVVSNREEFYYRLIMADKKFLSALI
jgi:hypothetical protein